MIQALKKYINEKMDFQQLHSLNESQTEIQLDLKKTLYPLFRKFPIWNRVRSDLINDFFFYVGDPPTYGS